MSTVSDKISEIATSPFVLLARIYFSLSCRRRCRQMSQLGRAMDVAQAADSVRNGGATLIIEAATPGWPAYRLWLTHDAASYRTRPDDWSRDRLYPQEDDLNFDHFLSRASGCARMISKWYFGQDVDSFLRRWFGAVQAEDCLFIWSGWIKPR